MGFLRSVLGALHVVGFAGNALLFLYVEWLYVRENLLHLINPLLQFQVILTLLAMPLFWVFAVLATVEYLVGAALERSSGPGG